MEEKKYASFGTRFAAGIIDLAIILPPFLLILYLLGIDPNTLITGNFTSETNRMITDAISWIITILYFGFLLIKGSQATIGKKIMKIYVGNLDGSTISTSTAFLRPIISLFSALILGLGYIIILFNKEKATLHDIICKTRVFCGKK